MSQWRGMHENVKCFNCRVAPKRCVQRACIFLGKTQISVGKRSGLRIRNQKDLEGAHEMAETVTGLVIGLERVVNSRTWVFVQGTGLSGGDRVTIESKDKLYAWSGTIRNGHINSDNTIARVRVTCTKGEVDDFAEEREGQLVGPGDIIDVDVTVTGADPVEDDGIAVFP